MYLYIYIYLKIQDQSLKFVNNLQGGWFDMGGCFEIILYPFSVSLNHIVWELIDFDILSNQLYVYHICHFQLSPTYQTNLEESVGWGEWISKLSLSLFQQQKSLITYNKIFRVEENLEIIGSKPPVLQMRSLTLLVQSDNNYLEPTSGLKPGCFPPALFSHLDNDILENGHHS